MTEIESLREVRTLVLSTLARVDDAIAAARGPSPDAAAPGATPQRNPLLDMSARDAIRAILSRGPMEIAEIAEALRTAGRPLKMQSLRVLLCHLAGDKHIARVGRGEYGPTAGQAS